MRKLLLDGFVIFLSVFASFSIDNYRDSLIEKEILNESVITLGDEISSNILYTKEHIQQLKNIRYLTNQVIENFKSIDAKSVFIMHDSNPYIHDFTIDGQIIYIKKYEENSINQILTWTNAWEPEIVFFQSMLNSGKLLEIKNKKLRKEIESIYTKQEERITGFFEINSKNSELLNDWFSQNLDQYDYDISANQIFNNSKDQRLKNLLKQKKWILQQRVSNLDNYLQALQNVVLLISTEYKKLD
tara:strand:+ start:1280 stop:2011 length:732 start_codon:yes stop_codon:yes gene_type:complete